MSTNDLGVNIRDEILITSLDEQEGIVLDIESKSYHLVNETGLFLLKVIEENGRQVSSAVLKSRLLHQYDVAAEEAERDILEFIRELAERNLASIG